MEDVKYRCSLFSQTDISNLERDESNDGSRLSRLGVLSRDAVLQQFQHAPEVVLIEFDDPRDNLGKKRRLFTSDHAKETMCRASGLPSPPDSSGPSPQASFLGSSAVAWLQNDDNVTGPHQTNSPFPARGLSLAEEDQDHLLSIQPGHLIGTPLLDSGGAEPALNADREPQNGKDVCEARSQARSEQLRAMRKAHSRANGSGGLNSEARIQAFEKRQAPEPSRQRREGVLAASHADHDVLSKEQEDKLFELADHLRAGEGPWPPKPSSSSIQSPKRSSGRFNPYSRTAAQKFRTQRRHLVHDPDNELPSTNATDQDQHDSRSFGSVRGSDKDAEERLERLKAHAFSKQPLNHRVIASKRDLRKLPPKFYAPPDNLTQHYPTKRKYYELASRIRGAEEKTKPLNIEPHLKQASNDDSDHPQMLSILRALQEPRKISSSRTSEKNKWAAILTSMPPQGMVEHLPNLPKEFEKMDAERQFKVMRRETVKSRIKDLETVSLAFTNLAQMLVLDIDHQKACQWLDEARHFAEEVLDGEKSGYLARKRIKQISDNASTKVRVQGGPLDEMSIDEKLREMLHCVHFDKLQKELPDLREELDILKAACDKYQKKRSNTIRRARRRKAQSSRSTMKAITGEGKEALIRSKLSQFQQYDIARNEEQRTEDVQHEREAYSTGLISDEDEDVDFMMPLNFGAGESTTLSQKEPTDANSNPRKDENQQVEPRAKLKTAQAIDLDLLARMTAKAKQQDHIASQGEQMQDPQMIGGMHAKQSAQAKQHPHPLNRVADTIEGESDIEMASAQEFDDSDLDEDCNISEEDDDEGQPFCKRYIVKALTSGISPRYDDSEQQWGVFITRDKAIEKLLNGVQKMKRAWHRCNPAVERVPFSLNVEEGDGQYEQQLTLGQTRDIGCRAWIEEQLYNPSKEAYEKAKVFKACRPINLWFVDWEKTTKPVEEPVNEIQSTAQEHAKEADEDDLFDAGPDTSKDAVNAPVSLRAPTEMAIERATGDQIRHFTLLAAANRHAKDVFMEWFIRHLPGRANHAYIASHDREIEETLQRIGDRASWSAEESFDLPVDDKGVKRTESLRVWVRKAKMSGPSN